MTETETAALPSVAEIQQQWFEVNTRLKQLEVEKEAFEKENKALRQQLEKLIAHRQASHSELVILLTSLVSKLPLNDVGTIVARLVEHNANMTHYMSALSKGAAEPHIEQPNILKTLEHTKRDLHAAIKPLVDELIKLQSPIEKEMLEGVVKDPDKFFSPHMVRAARCFFKGQVPKERIVREFGPDYVAFFNDLTTDPKLNPRPKQEEIVLSFRNDFESIIQQAGNMDPEKRARLQQLYDCIQRSKCANEPSKLQKSLFQRLSFVIELLHYYEHQSTENPEVIYAHRLPALVEQLVFTPPQELIDAKPIVEAESLLAYIINPDHRQMVINNIGKGSDTAKTLRYVLKLRAEKIPEMDQVIGDFIKHLIPQAPNKPPTVQEIARVVKLIHPAMQKIFVRSLMTSDRMRKDQAEALAKALSLELGLGDLQKVTREPLSPEADRQLAWGKIKEMIVRRGDPLKIADAIRDRLHERYDADEVRQSWITLTEADPLSLIRVFCHLPYGANGKTDPIARPIMETYVSRLTHDKYANTYGKIVRSLRNMFAAKPDSPTLMNFTNLVRWVSPEAADKLCADVGMRVAA